MNKIFGIVMLVCSIALLNYGYSFVSERDYYDGFDYNCKHNIAKDWSYDYEHHTLTILIGNVMYESVTPESFLDEIPRNKKLGVKGCAIVKQNLVH